MLVHLTFIVMAQRSAFLTRCCQRRIPIAALPANQVEILVEACHNIVNNPRVLLSQVELDCLKPVADQLVSISKIRQVVEARKLLTGLKHKHIACIARIGLQQYEAKS